MSVLPETSYFEELNPDRFSGDTTFRVMLDENQIGEKISEAEALEQSVLLNLMTERYAYEIFDRDYGLETSDLIGESFDYVKAVLPKRLVECLAVDDRITNIENIQVEKGDDGKSITVRATIISSYTKDIVVEAPLAIATR